MPIFINVLTEDRNDPEITRAALEALNTVCTAQTNVRCALSSICANKSVRRHRVTKTWA